MKSLRVMLAVALVIGSAGCRHRAAPVVPVAAQAPVALEPTPAPNLPPKVASVPTQPAPVSTIPLPKQKARRARHKINPVPAPGQPTMSASEAPPEEASVTLPPIAAVIGSLTTGEDASPATRQHAADLIASNDKRLKALSTQEVADHRSAVTRVGNFDRDAETALNSGDASGAITLASKAQVLLDDLNK